MRVVLFTTNFVESIVIDLANSLSEKSDVLLITPQNHYENYTSHISKKVKHETFFMPRMRSPKCFFMIKRIVDKINDYNPDVLHIQDNGHIWFITGLLRLRKTIIVNTIHDAKPHLGDKWSKLRFLSTRLGKLYTDYYITHSKKVKSEMSVLYNIRNDKIDVLPLGGHSYYWKIRDPCVEKKNTILFYGRIWEYKGLDILIRAESIISREIPDVKIIIAGRGENIKKYRKMIGNRQNFSIKNYRISDLEIPKLFQEASILALPYRDATQSGVIPLAYIFGKPVVVTNVGGLSEQLQDGVQGFIVPPEDEKAFASAVIRILKDDNIRKKMGENALAYYHNQLSGNRISRMTLETYEKALVSREGAFSKGSL